VDHRKIEEIVPQKFLKWKKVFRKSRIKKNTNKKNLGLYYRPQRDVQTTKRKDLSFI